MGKKTTYLQQVKHGMVKKLFNTEILSRPDVTPTEMSKVAHVTNAQVYRWLKRFGFRVKDGFRNDKTPDEIADLVWSTLKGQQIESLYEWAKKKRFSEKVTPKKRAYKFTEEGLEARRESRKRTKKDAQEEIAQNEKLVNESGIPQVDKAPATSQGTTESPSISKDLHDFVTTDESTEAQVENLLEVLLFDVEPETQAVKAMAENARKADDFNEKQWAFQELYTRSGRQAQSDFYQVVQGLKGEAEIAGRKATTELLKAYRQNEKYINMKAIK